ncbi:MAG TPA: YbaB/EbfC family nucleoid-associated protein [Microthrixaceae bacterium]|nr:YbaB/EbfC family nucleoid-associated protein [Microthrixaceae bacterium]
MNSDNADHPADEAGSGLEAIAGLEGLGIPSSPLGGGLDLGSMMQMAQSMQEQAAVAQQQLAETEVVGTAGGGVVTVTLNGHLHLRQVHIDPEAIDQDDPSMVEDLVVAAWQDAHDQVAVLQAGADPFGGLGGLLGGV